MRLWWRVQERNQVGVWQNGFQVRANLRRMIAVSNQANQAGSRKTPLAETEQARLNESVPKKKT